MVADTLAGQLRAAGFRIVPAEELFIETEEEVDKRTEREADVYSLLYEHKFIVDTFAVEDDMVVLQRNGHCLMTMMREFAYVFPNAKIVSAVQGQEASLVVQF